ncbi:MAG TPA: 5-formyltetrahydrofolate cyclo-ligase [Caulobacteraceae bacterium]|nr:5-formyltetrahydrofolate cyclo-ligase [Caulobacteraceae bacterium]
MSLTADAKAELRAALRRRRRALAAEAPDAPDEAAGRLPLDALPPFAAVAGYHPLGGEIDPGPVLRRFVEAGARLALPVAHPDAPLIFREARADDVTEPDAFGIPSPPATAPVIAPDIVVAPVLAFDRQGGRLGQGGGHYDRTLAALRAARPLFVIGLAYAGQEIEAAPMEPHDQRLDAILTEKGYIAVRKG